MRRTLSVLLLTAAAGLAHADGSAGAAAPASKKIPEEQPVPTTPLIIAGIALAAFAVVLLVGRRKKRNVQPQQLAGDLAEVRLVIETDEAATVTTRTGMRVSTDRLGEAVLNLPIGNHEVTIDVGAETFTRSISVTGVRKMRMPINLTKERISRAASGQLPAIPQTTSPPRTSAARAYPDAASQGELGNKLAGLIDVELDQQAVPQELPARKPSTTKSPPLRLDYSEPVVMPVAVPEPPPPALELDVDEELDLPVLPNVPGNTTQLPPSPVRSSPLAGQPPSAPEQRPNPLRDVVSPRAFTPARITKQDRQQAASAVADFAVDELVAASPKSDLSIGPIPDLDLAPPVQQSRAEAPRSYLDINEFALSELGAPQPALELELPAVTAASVADIELDLPRQTPAPAPVAKATPDIDDFELTPAPSAPPKPPVRSSRPSIQAASAPIGNRYRKTGGAGAGVIGALYRGRDEAAERDVWIEELPKDVTLAVPAAQLVKLEHANILRFYEHVSDPSKSYLISELVEGKSLEQLMTELGGVVSPLQAIAIVDQVCAGLAYAHQQGVFHRDLRPACVWISGRTARLTGFGITFGRPSPYQAPEVTAGGPPDVRADLYSMGLILAQLLTGAAPGDHLEFPPDVPRSLAGMIRKLVSREPMIRPNNLKVVRDAFSSSF